MHIFMNFRNEDGFLPVSYFRVIDIMLPAFLPIMVAFNPYILMNFRQSLLLPRTERPYNGYLQPKGLAKADIGVNANPSTTGGP